MLKYLVASHNASFPSKPPDNNVPFSSRRTQKMLFCLWKNKVRECATVTPLSWLATYKYISKIYSQMTTTFPNGVTWVKIFNTDTKGTETTINKLCYRGVYILEVHIFWSWYQVFHRKNASNEGVLIIKKISIRRGVTVGEVCMMLFYDLLIDR